MVRSALIALACLAACDSHDFVRDGAEGMSERRYDGQMGVDVLYRADLRKTFDYLVSARELARRESTSHRALARIDRSIARVEAKLQGREDSSFSRLKGVHRLSASVDQYHLIVRFKPTFIADLSEDNELTLFGHKAPSHIQRVIDQYELSFSPAILYSSEDRQILNDPVRRHIPDAKGFNRYDFSGLLYVRPRQASNRDLLTIAHELESLPEVYYASVDPAESEPPPVDYSPTTSDFTSLQSYLGPDPGIDIDYAWDLGLRGTGLTITDMEHSWGYLDHVDFDVHEDLHNQDLSYGLPWQTNDFEDHGTAVMGLLLAGDNGYGIKGSVPEARGLVYSVIHGDTQILAAAIDDLDVGDIMLMEMQRGDGGVPDIPAANWDLVKEAVDAGIIVVQTAGNGAQNMDAPEHQDYRDRGDNGAIRVGAGTSDTNHDKLGFSTYGAAVHIQGWGQNVFTLGYGAYDTVGGDPNQEYTGSFNGTSSAGPVATSAVALVQSYAIETLGIRLTSRQMRELLVETGVPQGSGGHIGPLPNIRAAIEKLDEDLGGGDESTGGGSTGEGTSSGGMGSTSGLDGGSSSDGDSVDPATSSGGSMPPGSNSSTTGEGSMPGSTGSVDAGGQGGGDDESGGCGCRSQNSTPSDPFAWLVLGGGFVLRRRRRISVGSH